MAGVITDRTLDLEVREDEGVVVFMRRQMWVTDLTSRAIGVFDEALETAGVPVAESQHDSYPNLILKERNCTLVDDDPEKVKIELVYNSLGTDGQIGFFTPRTSLKQVSSQNNRFGQQIVVTHTFPGDHDTFPGETITQGVEISALTPNVEIRRERNLFISNMTTFAAEWNGTINSNVWGGDRAGTWMCTNVTGKLIDGSVFPGKYKVEFTFLYDPLGHNPFVFFIDPTTGRPPPDIVPGTGSGSVDWYRPKHFAASFFEVITVA